MAVVSDLMGKMEQDTQVLVVLAQGIVALGVIARYSGGKLSAAEQIAFGLLAAARWSRPSYGCVP